MNDVCFFREKAIVNHAQFLTDIAKAKQIIALSSAQKVLLFDQDSYCFTVQFFALILSGREVLLPPNEQPGTLTQLSHLCDATMGTISLANKPAIDLAINKSADQISSSDACSVMNLSELFNKLDGKVTFFTSGSTGKPKAIIKQFRHILIELEILFSTFSKELKTATIVLSTVSHQHIYGLLFKILLPLKSGVSIVNQSFEYPEHINRYLSVHFTNDKQPQALLISSPAHLKRLVVDNVLIEYKQQFCSVFSSGGALSFDTSKQFTQQMAIAPIEVFGSTETGGIAWRKGQSSEKTAWSLFEGISYQGVKQQGSATANRLEISSPYIEQASYLTDDVIEAIDSSHFHLLGRVDRTIKLEEKRINLVHVERCLLTHPWVNEVRILVLDSESQIAQRQILASVIEISQAAVKFIEQKGKRSLNELFKQHLLTEFERICLPKKWRYITNFPYNSQGKITLSELEKLFD